MTALQTAHVGGQAGLESRLPVACDRGPSWSKARSYLRKAPEIWRISVEIAGKLANVAPVFLPPQISDLGHLHPFLRLSFRHRHRPAYRHLAYRPLACPLACLLSYLRPSCQLASFRHRLAYRHLACLQPALLQVHRLSFLHHGDLRDLHASRHRDGLRDLDDDCDPNDHDPNDRDRNSHDPSYKLHQKLDLYRSRQLLLEHHSSLTASRNCQLWRDCPSYPERAFSWGNGA